MSTVQIPLATRSPPTESEVRILSTVLRAGECTQPEIVRSTGLSQQTVSRLVNDLLGRGALALGNKRSSGRRGQPTIEITIAPQFAYSLGIALMTDALSVALMDFAGNVVGHEYLAMPVMSRKAVFARLREIRERFFAATPLARDRLLGAGIGILGPCLDGKARFNPPRALDEFAMVPIDELFADELGMPCWVESDGNAAAVGESFLGAGRVYANFVYIYVAAGLGGGIIINNRLLRGSHGNSGEIGRMLPWRNFQIPTLETLVQCLRKEGIETGGVSPMLAAFDPEWPGVDEWITQSRDQFSLIASAIAALVDPEAIVFGGRLPRALADKLLPALELFDDARREMPRPLPRIIASQTTYDACAIGAAMLPLEQTFYATMV
ncbi:ROK family transcriptional regulator [Novosphingobium piscinae]|uniref:ROK family transcriptional regulator n=1 Tax=Novosphingobium piscinae TaxID=1507448 RepID=A0A7X1KNJ9_9SPHN|nr:ROK family transcriptional regulator [Novosphingobium piscinae]MBC2667769.1 ROK family transcriptional regulator [Novosphingobium piscinae]